MTSKTTRAEPTQTKTLQQDYVNALVGLVKNYERSVLGALELLHPEHIDPVQFDDTVRAIGIATIIIPSSPIIDSHIKKSFLTGRRFADMHLKRYGVELSVPMLEFRKLGDGIGVFGGTGASSGRGGFLGEGPADWRTIDALKLANLSYLRGMNEEMNKRITTGLIEGVNAGEGIPKLTKRVQAATGFGKTRATVIARTETLKAYNQSAELRYVQAGVEKLEWHTALDERSMRPGDPCPDLNGTIFRVDSRHPRPPIHPNCRCTILPVFEKTPADEAARTRREIERGKRDIKSTAGKLSRSENTNRKVRDSIRKDMIVDYPTAYPKFSGKPLPTGLSDIHGETKRAVQAGTHFMTDQEIINAAAIAKRLKIAANQKREIALGNNINHLHDRTDADIARLVASGDMTQASRGNVISVLDRRVIGRGTEEYYIIDDLGKIRKHVSNVLANEHGLTASYRMSGGTIVMNSIDEVGALPLRYVMDAARAGIAEIRYNIHVSDLTAQFGQHGTVTRTIALRLNGVSDIAIDRAYSRHIAEITAEGFYTQPEIIARKAWQFTARDLGFDYDEIAI